MTLAVFAATTEVGRERLHQMFAEVHEVLIPSGGKPVKPLDAVEGRRLAETVRALVADRERLVARLATLEQNVDTVTGSIAKMEKSIEAAAVSPETVSPPAPPALRSPPEEVTSSIPPPPAAPAAPPAGTVSKTEFGIDLGSAPSVEALRTAWNAALKRHGSLLQGLHPAVQTRERPKPAPTEYRLIAGPIANAATAARICATITASGGICAPSIFDGQRLAVR
jgi:hypothetical protein